jgi:metal-responsive CopG/Arc/MetJ family transcriptional regulator
MPKAKQFREMKFGSRITVLVPSELVKKIDAVAQRRFTTQSEIIRQAVIAALAREEQQSAA